MLTLFERSSRRANLLRSQQPAFEIKQILLLVHSKFDANLREVDYLPMAPRLRRQEPALSEKPAKPRSVKEIEHFLNHNAAPGNTVELSFKYPRSAGELLTLGGQIGQVVNKRIAGSIRFNIDDRYKNQSKPVVKETLIKILKPSEPGFK